MTAPILDGVRIIDLSDGIAGPVASMLLAECGADVIKVEAPEGSHDRSLPGFRTWNRSKRSVIIDVESSSGRAQLDTLLASADVLVHDRGPARARAVGLDDAALGAQHAQLIVCSVLGWPANHPDADRPVDEVLAMARLGISDEQRAMRREGPVFIRFPLGSWGAVYLAAIGIVSRLIVRGATGRGGVVHTSLAQGALVPMGMHWSRADHPSENLAVGMPKASNGSQATLFECSDGQWIHLMPPGADEAPLMRQLLEEMGEARVQEANATFKGFAIAGIPNIGANAEAFRMRSSAVWLDELWRNDIPVQLAAPFGAIYDDEQALANQYVIEIDDPEAGRITVPGYPMTIDPPMAMRGTAPALGAHTDDVRREWSTPQRPTDPGRPPARPAPTRWPLEGVRVLDFGNFLAGPYGPMLLADLGADVIKVEATTADPMRWADWPFAGCQRGKRTVALDLKSPAARPALEALVRSADIVHHNLRMPAAKRLGLDDATLRALKPDLIYCHTSSYGPAGPRADWPGYDQLFQAQCGWEVLGAGRDNPPMWHRFGFMDHQCALSSIVATLLALYERDRTGRGQFVAGSLLGAGVMTVSETYRLENGSLVAVDELDPQQLGISDDVRLAETADGWIAIAARTPTQRRALATVAEVADPIARSSASLLAALEHAGVPAERVRLDQRIPFFDDAANRATRLVAEYQHAEWGRLEQPGAMWSFGDLDVRLDLAPPVLGEHSVEVLTEVGFSADEIAQLLEQGATVQHRA